MACDLFFVDAFTRRPFRGNPAAVHLGDGKCEASWMQSFAAEMNLSETAFLAQDGERFGLRWFTPAVEVDLCGHATLASAHVLWSEGHVARESTIRFDTRSGELTARIVDGRIELNFPATPARAIEPTERMIQALGVEPLHAGQSRFDILIEVASEEEVRNLRPRFDLLRDVPGRGFMVTARSSGAPYDFVSRFFAPAAGVDEDPVTGSAHCCLAPYWAGKLGKDRLFAYQASARGGELRLAVDGDRVRLAGDAVTVMRGTIAVE